MKTTTVEGESFTLVSQGTPGCTLCVAAIRQSAELCVQLHEAGGCSTETVTVWAPVQGLIKAKLKGVLL